MYTPEAILRLFRYYNLGHRDPGRIYFTDLQLMFSISGPQTPDHTPNLNSGRLDKPLGKHSHPEDLVCAFFEREVKLFINLGNILNRLKGTEFELVWRVLDARGRGEFDRLDLDSFLLAPLTQNEWDTLARRLMHKPKTLIPSISRSDFKIFLQIFLPELRIPANSHLHSSSSMISQVRANLPGDFIWLPYPKNYKQPVQEHRSAAQRNQTVEILDDHYPQSAPQALENRSAHDSSDEGEADPRTTAFTLGQAEPGVSAELLSGGLVGAETAQPVTPMFPTRADTPFLEDPAHSPGSSCVSSANSSPRQRIDLSDLCGGAAADMQASKLRELGQDWDGLQALMSIDSNDDSVQVFADDELGLGQLPPEGFNREESWADDSRKGVSSLDVDSLRMKYSGSAEEDLLEDHPAPATADKGSSNLSLGQPSGQALLANCDKQNTSLLRQSRVRVHPKIAWGKKLFTNEQVDASRDGVTNQREIPPPRCEMRLPNGKLESVIKENEKLIEEIGKKIASKMLSKLIANKPQAFCYDYSVLETGKGDVQSTFAGSPYGQLGSEVVPQPKTEQPKFHNKEVSSQMEGQKDLKSKFPSDGLKILGISGQQFRLPLTRSNNLAGNLHTKAISSFNQHSASRNNTSALRKETPSQKAANELDPSRSGASSSHFVQEQRKAALAQFEVSRSARTHQSRSHNKSKEPIHNLKAKQSSPFHQGPNSSKPLKRKSVERVTPYSHEMTVLDQNTPQKQTQLKESQQKALTQKHTENDIQISQSVEKDRETHGSAERHTPSNEKLRRQRAVWHFVRGLK